MKLVHDGERIVFELEEQAGHALVGGKRDMTSGSAAPEVSHTGKSQLLPS